MADTIVGEAVDAGEGGVAGPWPGGNGSPVDGPPCAILDSNDSRTL